MELLLLLILAHILGDFYFQKNSWVACRQENHLKSPALYKHLLVHLVFTSLALLFAPIAISWQLPAAVALVVISHFIIDLIKSYLRPNLLNLVLDQLVHFLVLLFIWAWLDNLGWELVYELGYILLSPETLLLIAIYLIAATPTSILISTALKSYTRQLENAEDPQGLEKAGRLIGYTERWLIISFVLVGQYTGIGFLLAAKSIFRFGDLTSNHERRLTEYMLLGTLFSFAVALALGGIARYWLP
ncbi:DUF3307 domain-containing protein [Aliidiomarina minuta]|uniref:DUF3307 domain-containing protein n=1 Tax=Aliidiomarina minuta TaxID=880057 RepID=A0A432W9M5_9GAMM|nr:DUF3307 domain-containing protein [Aliidiomarina minuta]RUO26298.1 DUF3307 domain-containing protein [Aliidiomarina minuta]